MILILVVVEDGLVHFSLISMGKYTQVLILVVVEDGLVLKERMDKCEYELS